MIRLLADENFNGRILRALQRRVPTLDVVRAQDVLPLGTPDPELLRWSAEADRVVLTHDVATLVGYTYDLVLAGTRIPGVIAVPSQNVIGPAVEDLEILIRACEPEELQNQVLFIPL